MRRTMGEVCNEARLLKRMGHPELAQTLLDCVPPAMQQRQDFRRTYQQTTRRTPRMLKRLIGATDWLSCIVTVPLLSVATAALYYFLQGLMV